MPAIRHHSRYCPACRSETLHEALYEKNGCSVSRCATCGLGRATPGEFDPAAFYTTAYFDGSHPDGYSDYAASEPVLRKEFSRVVALLERYCAAGARVLEVGCAFGFFLQEARKTFEVTGIEIAADAVQACRSAGLTNVQHGVADEATLARVGTVDAIVMLDVIEHLTDPAATLQLCCEHLRPGGVVLVTTGDFASPLARLAGRHWRLMTPPQHLWFFTPRSVSRLAESLGLTLVSCTHPWKIVPFSLIRFQLARMLGLEPKAAPDDALSRRGIPLNLFDAMRLVLRKPATGGGVQPNA